MTDRILEKVSVPELQKSQFILKPGLNPRPPGVISPIRIFPLSPQN